jgi:hypothetical protein
MLRSHGLGRLMNPRRIPLTLGTAVGVAFAALIGVAPAARADGPDPFEDLFGDTGINAWTPAADASLLSSDPTEAANLDASVENFLADAHPSAPNFPRVTTHSASSPGKYWTPVRSPASPWWIT